ncbi:hypothetical protein ONZ45_g12707 [Pleurotus djamor]|nr:hypothetical protein ONZ45_g12707 [Pleurotus djamor]
MSGKSALLIGSTGQVGRHLLNELLSSNDFSRVGEYGRRVTSLEKIATGKDKIEQKTVDFEKLKPSEWEDGKWDVVFITLGTTRKAAGSAEAFEKIDREFVLNAAKAAKSDDPAHEQRIVYCSSTGANPKSPFLYPKSKGLTEQGLAALGYSDTIVFRPGFLKGTQREEPRLAESIFGYVTGFLSHIGILAKSMRIAGRLGSPALPAVAEAAKDGPKDASFTVVTNKGALQLANTN